MEPTKSVPTLGTTQSLRGEVGLFSRSWLPLCDRGAEKKVVRELVEGDLLELSGGSRHAEAGRPSLGLGQNGPAGPGEQEAVQAKRLTEELLPQQRWPRTLDSLHHCPWS